MDLEALDAGAAALALPKWELRQAAIAALLIRHRKAAYGLSLIECESLSLGSSAL